MKEDTKKIKSPKSFCTLPCQYYKVVDAPDFTAPNGKGTMELCSYGDGDRSFGCLNACPKRFGE